MNPTDEEVAAALAAAKALLMVDLPIARGVTEEHFIVSYRRTFVEAQAHDPELQILRSFMQASKVFKTDKLLGESQRLKQLAQLAPCVFEREDRLLFRRFYLPERELTLVPAGMVKRIIPFLHVGPGSAHHATKATSSKIIRTLFWFNLMKDV